MTVDADSGLRSHDLPDGTTVHVDRHAADRGSEGLFHHVYDSPAGERRWGYRCGACGSFDTAMDTMGRVVCGECPNRRSPDGWDAAHE